MSYKTKAIIGLTNIANVHVNLCESLKRVGISCDVYEWSTINHPFYNNISVRKLFLFNTTNPPFRIFGINIFARINKILMILYFLKLLLKYNTFFFFTNSNFDERLITLKILKLLKKKIIFMFTGCLERDPYFDKINKDYICNNCMDINLQKYCYCDDLAKKRRRIEKIEMYSNYILSIPDTSSFIKDKSKVIWFYLAEKIEEKDYLKKFTDSNIRIVHLPSNSKIKQTHKIVPILENLSKNENVEIIIKENVWTRDEILSTLEKSHILVNVLGTGYNTLAIEAMARGCVVLNSHYNWFKENVPEAPIVDITEDNLEIIVNNLVQNHNLLYDLANKSIEYVKKYHSYEAVGNFYKQNLNLS